MRVVITRPAGDTHTWVSVLQAAGHAPLALPLIDIGPPRDLQPLQQAWSDWAQWQAVMFVSAQAVRHFFQHQPAGMSWATGPRCWATGPGTRHALQQAGVPEAYIDSPAVDALQFDSEALWQRVAPSVKAGQHVLIVRGQDAGNTAHASPIGTGRDWLAQQLAAVGALPQFVVAYERRLPAWTNAQKAVAAQAVTDGSVWCFSSSQAIEHLRQLLPTQSWRQARCIATHARIAQSAQALGFADIHLSRPDVMDVLRSLECLA